MSLGTGAGEEGHIVPAKGRHGKGANPKEIQGIAAANGPAISRPVVMKQLPRSLAAAIKKFFDRHEDSFKTDECYKNLGSALKAALKSNHQLSPALAKRVIPDLVTELISDTGGGRYRFQKRSTLLLAAAHRITPIGDYDLEILRGNIEQFLLRKFKSGAGVFDCSVAAKGLAYMLKHESPLSRLKPQAVIAIARKNIAGAYTKDCWRAKFYAGCEIALAVLDCVTPPSAASKTSWLSFLYEHREKIAAAAVKSHEKNACFKTLWTLAQEGPAQARQDFISLLKKNPDDVSTLAMIHYQLRIYKDPEIQRAYFSMRNEPLSANARYNLFLELAMEYEESAKTRRILDTLMADITVVGRIGFLVLCLEQLGGNKKANRLRAKLTEEVRACPLSVIQADNNLFNNCCGFLPDEMSAKLKEIETSSLRMILESQNVEEFRDSYDVIEAELLRRRDWSPDFAFIKEALNDTPAAGRLLRALRSKLSCIDTLFAVQGQDAPRFSGLWYEDRARDRAITADERIAQHALRVFELEDLHPGAAEFLYQRCGLRMFGRYPLALLSRQYEFYQTNPLPNVHTYLKEPAGAVTLFLSVSDQTGAFFQLYPLIQLGRECAAHGIPFIISEFGSARGGLRQAVRRRQEFGALQAVVFNAHGGSDGQTLEIAANQDLHTAALNDARLIRIFRRLLSTEGTIVANTCYAGTEDTGGFWKNLLLAIKTTDRHSGISVISQDCAGIFAELSIKAQGPLKLAGRFEAHDRDVTTIFEAGKVAKSGF